MWTCPRCGESIDDGFAVCWQCGTDHRGNLDPSFTREVDGLLEDGEPTYRPVQFSLRFMFVCATMAGLIVGVVAVPNSVSFIFWSIVAANVLGLIVGLFVTHVLRFPNDGSFTWRDWED